MTKKKAFQIKACSLNEIATSKPIGVRMGGGKGKPQSRFAIHVGNQPYIVLREAQNSTAEALFRLLRGYTSSKLGLILRRTTY